jgi:hypothetical protein
LGKGSGERGADFEVRGRGAAAAAAAVAFSAAAGRAAELQRRLMDHEDMCARYMEVFGQSVDDGSSDTEDPPARSQTTEE